jgi:putative ABC transport system permease protein
MHSKLRTWLTITGVVIGVIAVVLIISLGNALQSSILADLSGLKPNVIFIVPGNMRAYSGGSSGVSGTPIANLTTYDLSTLALANNILYSTGGVESTTPLIFRNQRATVTVEGVDPKVYFQFNSDVIGQGRMFSSNSANEVVLGYDIANQYFSTPILPNYQIELDGKYFQVVGVLAPSGSLGGDDSTVLMNTGAARTLLGFGTNQFSYIQVEVADATIVNQTVNDLTSRLQIDHHVDAQNQDFTIIAAQSILASISSIISELSLFLAALAAISLVVGIIGIANTMFMAVLERTKQIGVYKALGATRLEIVTLFLIEASLLSLVGGLIGVGFCIILTAIITQVSLASNLGFVVTVDPLLIIESLTFSMLIGAAAGVIPALQAASLNVVEALRFDF